MHAYATARWTLPAGIILLAGGAMLIWAGAVSQDVVFGPAGLVSGVLLGGLGLVAIVFNAAARTTREKDERKLAKYGCDRCGYVPKPKDLEEGGSFPCPSCGRPLYPKP